MRVCILLLLLTVLVTSLHAEKFTGKVVDPDGKPIAGARVVLTLFTERNIDPLILTTKKDGIFTFDCKAPRRPKDYLGRAVAYLPGLAIGGVLLGGDGNIIQLHKAGTISGTVVNAEGKPVAGARVRLSGTTPPPEKARLNGVWLPTPLVETFSVKTDAEGRWTLAGVPLEGKATIALDDPNYARMTIQASLGSDAGPEFTARPAAIFTGVIRNDAGKPVQGVRIFAQSQNAGGWSEDSTAADGSFRLGGLETGSYNVMTEEKTGDWVAAAREGVIATEGQTSRLDPIILSKGVFLEGDVVDDETGAPVADVNLGCYGPHRPRSSAAVISTRTDAKGHYRFRVLPGSCYVYIMERLEGYLTPQDGVTIQVKAGEPATVPFRLSRGLLLSGIALTADGKPAAGVNLCLSMRESRFDECTTTIDAAGNFCFSGLQAGKATISVAEDLSDVTWQVIEPKDVTIPGTGPVKVVVKPIAYLKLTGRVVTPAGQPVAGVKVRFSTQEQRGDYGYSYRQEGQTDATGQFTLPRINPDHTVTFVGADKPDHRYLRGGTVSKVGGGLQIADIIMAPLIGTVSGVVRDAAGTPAAGAKVVGLEGGFACLATCDAAGRFTLAKLPEGAITVMAATATTAVAQQTTTGVNALTLPLPAPRPQPGQDIQRAATLLESLIPKMKEKKDYRLEFLPAILAPYDLPRALELAKQAGGRAKDVLISSTIDRLRKTNPPQLTDEHLQLIDQLADPNIRYLLQCQIGPALAKRDPAKAAELYTKCKRQMSVAGGDLGLQMHVLLTTFAFALKNGEGEALLQKTLTTLKARRDADDLLVMLAGYIAEVDPDQAITVAHALHKKPDQEMSALCLVVKAVARQDTARARALLAEIKQDAGFETEYGYWSVVRVLIEASGKDDPAGALALAQTVTGQYTRPEALTLAARYQEKTAAEKLYRDAAALLIGRSEYNDGLSTLAQLALQASVIDSELGRDLFAQARKRLRENDPAPAIAYAYYYSHIDPAESRLRLECLFAELSKGKKPEYEASLLLRVVMAMAPIDFDRALEMARAIPDNEAQLKLAQYLAAPEATRRTQTLEHWLSYHSLDDEED